MDEVYTMNKSSAHAAAVTKCMKLLTRLGFTVAPGISHGGLASFDVTGVPSGPAFLPLKQGQYVTVRSAHISMAGLQHEHYDSDGNTTHYGATTRHLHVLMLPVTPNNEGPDDLWLVCTGAQAEALRDFGNGERAQQLSFPKAFSPASDVFGEHRAAAFHEQHTEQAVRLQPAVKNVLVDMANEDKATAEIMKAFGLYRDTRRSPLPLREPIGECVVASSPGYAVRPRGGDGWPIVRVQSKMHSFFKAAGGDMKQAYADVAKFAKVQWHKRLAPSSEQLKWFMQGCPADGQLLPPYGSPPTSLIERAREAATRWAKALGRLPAAES